MSEKKNNFYGSMTEMGATRKTLIVSTEMANNLIKEFPDMFKMAETKEKYGKGERR